MKRDYSYLQIDRPESIFVQSPLLFSCGAGQTKGSRLSRYFVGRDTPELQVLDCATFSFDTVFRHHFHHGWKPSSYSSSHKATMGHYVCPNVVQGHSTSH
ncbi:hypothetical protein BDR03DRAFT_621972 [Suillus americanus]|nr:hypothetical protein BDR03DRAFT_621972 [Suillus americanus]